MNKSIPSLIDISVITKYLDEGIDMNIPLFQKKKNNFYVKANIFTYICTYGTREIVNLFIRYGANVNDFSTKHYPLEYAFDNLKKDIVEELINAGANITNCKSVLYRAVKGKSYEHVKIALDYDVKVDECVMQLVESNYDNDIIKKLITDAVQVQSRKRLREPSPEVIQKQSSLATQKDIDELINNSPLLTEEDKDVIAKFFTSPCVYPRTTPQRSMKLREIVTPQGIEKIFLILRFDNMSYQKTCKFAKYNETKKVIDLTHL